MKITFVTDTYAPQPNGVATTLHRLVTGLRGRGHEVDVIRPASLASEEEGMEVPSVSMPGYPEVRLGIPMRLILQSKWFRNRPDVIYVATEFALGASAINAARALKIPVASGFHTNFQQYVSHYKVPLLERATLSYLRRIHNRSSCTFVPSRDTIEQLDEQGFENLALLPKGVDTKLFSPKKRDLLLRAKWGARENTKVGLYVGRIAAEKNLPLIVHTFVEIKKRFPDFVGVFVGDGPKLEELRKEHPEFVYMGVQRGDDLAASYASADLFIFPSTTETFGNVTLEAMASGLGVVAYNYAAALQHIRHGKNGFVAEFDNAEDFVAKTLEALVSPDLDQIRKSARSCARKVRWKKVVKRFEKSLVQLTEGTTPMDNEDIDDVEEEEEEFFITPPAA